ncbi:MAG: hypothetical protein AAGA60_30990 [Cyanobacteria bacterium P01_E01_bin.42]
MSDFSIVFDGNLSNITENVCLSVKHPAFYGLFLPTIPPNITKGFDVNLNVDISDLGQKYRVPWQFEVKDNIYNSTLDNKNLLPVGSELASKDYAFSLVIQSDEVIPARVFALANARCGCKSELDAINTKLNLKLGADLLRTIVNLLPVVIGGVAPELLLPAVAANAVRGLVKIFLPDNALSPVLIGHGYEPTPTIYDDILYPGQVLEVDEWQGSIFGRSLTGDAVTLSGYRMTE